MSDSPMNAGRGAASEQMAATTTPTQVHDIGRRRAWLVWTVAVSVYALAVFNRSTLGVAGLMAAERFDIAATQLAAFTVLQLIIYAGMQVPVGVLLDRFGPRRLLLAGLVLMTGAQVLFAFVDSYAMAVLARGLVGAGDAMVFITVIRLVNTWFRPGQVPMLTQVTGWVGQLGAIVAATPLTLLLNHYGWTTAFALCSTVGLLLLIGVLLAVKDSPYAGVNGVGIPLGELVRSVRTVWNNPGTRLGFWIHFSTQGAFTLFALLWGAPFLIRGQGWTPVQAANLLAAMTGWVVVSGLVIGWFTVRAPFRRTRMAILVVLAQAGAWGVLLSFDEPAPGWLVVAVVFVATTGGPASVIGFDIARTFNPDAAIGRATGLVNVGGFVASLTMMAMIGVILDLCEPRGAAHYGLDDFRLAFCAQYVIFTVGIVQMVRLRRRAVTHLDDHHPGATDALREGVQWTPAHGASARSDSARNDSTQA